MNLSKPPFTSEHHILIPKVGDTAVTAAQDRGHDALALQIARLINLMVIVVTMTMITVIMTMM